MGNERHLLTQIEDKTSKLIDILPQVDDKTSFINLYLYRNSHMKHELKKNTNVLVPYYDILNVHSQVVLYRFIERYPNAYCSLDGDDKSTTGGGDKNGDEMETVNKDGRNDGFMVESIALNNENMSECRKTALRNTSEDGSNGNTSIPGRIERKSCGNEHEMHINRCEAAECCTNRCSTDDNGKTVVCDCFAQHETESHEKTEQIGERTHHKKKQLRTNDNIVVEEDRIEFNDETMDRIEALGLNIHEMKQKLKIRVVDSTLPSKCKEPSDCDKEEGFIGVPSGYTNFEKGLINEYILKSSNYHPKYLQRIKDKLLIFDTLFDQFIVHSVKNNEYAKYLLDKMIILMCEYRIEINEGYLRTLSTVMRDYNELTFVLGAFMSGKEEMFNGLIMERKYRDMFVKMMERQGKTEHGGMHSRNGESGTVDSSNVRSTAKTDTTPGTGDEPSFANPVGKTVFLSKTHNFTILNLPQTLQQTLQQVQSNALPINVLLFHLNSAPSRTIKNYKGQLFSLLLNNTFHPLMLKLLMERSCEYRTVIEHFFSFQSYGTQRVIILECLMMLIEDGWELGGEMVRMFFGAMDGTAIKFNEVLESRVVAFYEKIRNLGML